MVRDDDVRDDDVVGVIGRWSRVELVGWVVVVVVVVVVGSIQGKSNTTSVQ